MNDDEPVPSDLPSRIVFSLLRGAVRLSARMGLPLKRVVHLTRLAYYQELREQYPRNRKAVAEALGVSLRTAAELGSHLGAGFLEPEESVQITRRVRERIDRAPCSTQELVEELALESEVLDGALEILVANGWIEDDRGTWRLKGDVQSFLGGALTQKIDGLNRQQHVIAEAAWASFFRDPSTNATARTWVFHADPEQFETFRERAVRSLRSQSVELDEAAVESSDSTSVGVTVVFSRMTP